MPRRRPRRRPRPRCRRTGDRGPRGRRRPADADAPRGGARPGRMGARARPAHAGATPPRRTDRALRCRRTARPRRRALRVRRHRRACPTDSSTRRRDGSSRARAMATRRFGVGVGSWPCSTRRRWALDRRSGRPDRAGSRRCRRGAGGAPFRSASIAHSVSAGHEAVKLARHHAVPVPYARSMIEPQRQPDEQARPVLAGQREHEQERAAHAGDRRELLSSTRKAGVLLPPHDLTPETARSAAALPGVLACDGRPARGKGGGRAAERARQPSPRSSMRVGGEESARVA